MCQMLAELCSVARVSMVLKIRSVAMSWNDCPLSMAVKCLRCWHVSLLEWISAVLVSAQALDPI